MSQDTRNLCLSLINESKELTDSPRVVDKHEPFEIVSINIRKEKEIVSFNGFISNSIENKVLDGRIVYSNGKYYIKTNVYRLYEYLDEDERDYNLEEEFELLDDKLIC